MEPTAEGVAPMLSRTAIPQDKSFAFDADSRSSSSNLQTMFLDSIVRTSFFTPTSGSIRALLGRLNALGFDVTIITGDTWPGARNAAIGTLARLATAPETLSKRAAALSVRQSKIGHTCEALAASMRTEKKAWLELHSAREDLRYAEYMRDQVREQSLADARSAQEATIFKGHAEAKAQMSAQFASEWADIVQDRRATVEDRNGAWTRAKSHIPENTSMLTGYHDQLAKDRAEVDTMFALPEKTHSGGLKQSTVMHSSLATHDQNKGTDSRKGPHWIFVRGSLKKLKASTEQTELKNKVWEAARSRARFATADDIDKEVQYMKTPFNIARRLEVLRVPEGKRCPDGVDGCAKHRRWRVSTPIKTADARSRRRESWSMVSEELDSLSADAELMFSTLGAKGNRHLDTAAYDNAFAFARAVWDVWQAGAAFAFSRTGEDDRQMFYIYFKDKDGEIDTTLFPQNQDAAALDALAGQHRN